MSAVIPDPALTDWVPLWSLGAPSGLVMVEDKLLSAAAASFDFQNIPQTYKSLLIVLSAKSDQAATQLVGLRFNNDSGGNYNQQGAALGGGAWGAIATGGGVVSAACAQLGGTADVGTPSAGQILIPDYAGSTLHKTFVAEGTYGRIGKTTFAGGWNSAVAINRITLTPYAGNFVAGSRATLYALTDVTAPPAVWTPPTYGTSLPGSPADGQEHTLVDSLTNPTYQWRFRYNAGNSTAYKWEFIGGTPINKEEAANHTTTSTTYVDPTTTPSFTVPRAGVYDVHYGSAGLITTNDTGYISLYIGAIAIDANGVYMFRGDQGQYVNDRHLAVTVAASTLLKVQVRYAASTGGSSFGTRNRFLHITPVRVA